MFIRRASDTFRTDPVINRSGKICVFNQATGFTGIIQPGLFACVADWTLLDIHLKNKTIRDLHPKMDWYINYRPLNHEKPKCLFFRTFPSPGGGSGHVLKNLFLRAS